MEIYAQIVHKNVKNVRMQINVHNVKADMIYKMDYVKMMD